MSAVPAGVVPVVPRAGHDPSLQPPAGATCLSEESRTYLLDGIVYRPQVPWTSTVHALLRHVESVGYRGSPRLLGAGIDAAGRHQMRYVDGELVQPYPWSDPGINEVARLLRELHDATTSFVPPEDSVWMPCYTHRPNADPVFGHGDVGPWNIVVRDGVPIALIDWEFAGPVERLDEVADEAVITPDFRGPHPMVWGMAWQIRGARWILDHTGLLADVLGVSK